MDPGDLVFTVRNVERRRKIREMLRTKETAFSISHAALFACDREGRFTEANAAFLEMFALADEDAARKLFFRDLLSDDPLPENFQKALEGEGTSISIVAETDTGETEQEIEVILVGLCTDICVVSNAMLIKAALPEIEVSVVADACAGVTPDTHAAALTTMKMCQINII